MYIAQYELWTTCFNNCEFCINEHYIHDVNVERQRHALQSVIDNLDVIYETVKDTISVELIGGDFFQGQLNDPETKRLWYALMDKLHKLGEEEKIQEVVIFATLTIGDHSDLFKSINIIKPNKDSKLDLWVSTSYDTRGRFITPKHLECWQHNMLELGKLETVKLNTTLILTQDCVEKINSGELDLEEFAKTYKTTLFFKQPTVPDKAITYEDIQKSYGPHYMALKEEYKKRFDWFLCKRSDTMKAMRKLKQLGILDRLMGLNYRADNLAKHFTQKDSWDNIKRDKKTQTEGDVFATAPCGHLYYYRCYSDSDKCILCDKEALLED